MNIKLNITIQKFVEHSFFLFVENYSKKINKYVKKIKLILFKHKKIENILFKFTLSNNWLENLF